MHVIKFHQAPVGCMFTVIKEVGRSSHAAGRYIKQGNSHSTQWHSAGKDIILSLHDLVHVIPNNMGGRPCKSH